jgi:hypothetical protein
LEKQNVAFVLPGAGAASNTSDWRVCIYQSEAREKRPEPGSGVFYIRIASGEKWLALIGDDTDFTPKEPWARRNSERGEKL